MNQFAENSADILQVIFNSVNDAIFIHHLDGTIIDVNEKMLKLYGIEDKEEALKLSIINDYSSPLNQLEQLPLIWEKVLSGEKQLFQWKARRPGDGFVFEVEVFLCRLELENNNVILATVRDISHYKQTEAALKESEQKYKQILASIQEGYYETDLAGNFIYVNESYLQISGYAKEDLLGKSYKVIHQNPAEDFKKYREVFITGIPEKNHQLTLTGRDGRKIFAVISISLTKDENGSPIGFRGLVRDDTERKIMVDALQESEERFRYMAEFSPFPLAIIDQESNYEYINPKFTETFGYTLQDIPDRKKWFVLAFPDPLYRQEVISAWINDLKNSKEDVIRPRTFKVTCKDGSVKDILFRPVTMKNGKQFITYEDITDRLRAEEHIRFLSYHDKLTGLYNRAFFEEEIRRLDTERQLPLSIIMGDANGLKAVNDTFGHKKGDELLVKIATIIKDSCRQEDIVCRWGGDEFAILLPNTNNKAALKLINRINNTLSKAEPIPVQPSAAFGCATKVTPAQSIVELLVQADTDMYKAKRRLP